MQISYCFKYFTIVSAAKVSTMLSGACHHDTALDCGWRRWPPDMQSSCGYIELAITNI